MGENHTYTNKKINRRFLALLSFIVIIRANWGLMCLELRRKGSGNMAPKMIFDVERGETCLCFF